MAPAPRPVIVGAGLTGCAISRALARAGVAHVLVGDPPSAQAHRLGESLNLEGSIDIEAFFPELSEAYLAKTAVNAHLGDLELRCDLNMDRGAGSSLFYKVLGYDTPPKAFLHIDREQIDERVYALVTAHPLCEAVAGRVTEVEHDRASDRVEALVLGDGQRLVPSYVFDASNQAGAVARHLGLERKTFGGQRTAVYGHQSTAGLAGQGDAYVWHSTHLVRMDRKRDGFDALVWFIPLKGRASIGVVVDGEAPEDDEEMLQAGIAALERRHIVPPATFTGRDRRYPRLTYRHYTHDRGYGANWLLAGGTFCLMAFGTSAGVSTGLAAGTCAPAILQDPLGVGARYEALLKALKVPHAVFEWLEHVDPDTVGQEEFVQRGGVLVTQSVRRLAGSIQLDAPPVRHAVAGVLKKSIEADLFDPVGICVSVARTGDRDAHKAALLDRLQVVLDAFAGHRPIEDVDTVMHPEVLVHMDWLSFAGVGGWKKWARHSQATWELPGLRFEVVAAELDPVGSTLKVDMVAVVSDTVGPRRSPPASFRYRFEQGRIVEVWTSRHNYTFLYGPQFSSVLGFFSHVAKMELWSRRHERMAG